MTIGPEDETPPEGTRVYVPPDQRRRQILRHIRRAIAHHDGAVFELRTIERLISPSVMRMPAAGHDDGETP